LQLACSLESHSTHPIARAIMKEARKEQLIVSEVQKFKNLVGMGVEGYIKGQLVVLGKRDLLGLGDLDHWQKNLSKPSMDYSEVWVITGNTLGRILLKDEIREASKPVLKALKDLAIETIMLTGDHAYIAEDVGRQIGVGSIRSGLTPEGKVAALQSLKQEGKIVAMVGDGVNDAPCLAMADVAIAMGARGSDAALEQSEVVLMNDKIELVLSAYALSRYAKKIIQQNLTIAIVTIICMILSSIAGVLPLSIGVLAHEGSTFLVCLNSLRILFMKQRSF
jgi:Cd2+/Zn2+-exporting ATPase